MKRLTYGIPGILLVVLACVAIVACRPAQPTSDPAAEPASAAPGGPRIFHDDPIVIDNAPLRIDLGREAEHENNKKLWKRKAHYWDYLAVLHRKNGEAGYAHVGPMCRTSCKIELDLTRIDNPNISTTVTLALTHGASGQMTMTDGKRKFEPNGRWLEPYYPDDETKKDNLRIRYVRAFRVDKGKEEVFYAHPFPDEGQVDIVIITREEEEEEEEPKK